MPCLTDDCRQGRARCVTPLTCSGFDAESAIAALRLTHSLHRVDDFTPAKPGLYAPLREVNEAQEKADTPDDFMTFDGVVDWFAARLSTAALWAGTFAALGWIAWLMTN